MSVKLNIGGSVFETSRSTLSKFAGMFRTMLETGVPLETDEAGCVFIDRDPHHFRLILNYMRDGVVALPDAAEHVEQIKAEASFYLLDELVSRCEEKLERKWKRGSFELDGFRVLRSRDEVFEKAANCEKPVLVIHYTVNPVGLIEFPGKVRDFEHFIRKYERELDVYFTFLENHNEWQWSFYSSDRVLSMEQALHLNYCSGLDFVAHLELHMKQVLKMPSRTENDFGR